MDKRTFDEQYEKAKRAAEAADAIEPRADRAYYDRVSHLIVVHLRNDESFSFSPTVVEELAHGSPNELKQIEVSPSGDGLSWPALDVDLGLVSLMHITSGPTATAATTAASDASELLEHLYTQIEMAWMKRGAVPLVDQLSTRHPEYRDELYDFLASLVDSELGEPVPTEEILRSADRTKKWLMEEGYELAAQAAKDMRQHDTTTDPTDPKDNLGSVEADSVSSSDDREWESEGTLALGFMGLLQLRTNRLPQQLLDEIDIPDFILTFVQDNPTEEMPEGARKEIIRRARDKGWIREGEGEAALDRRMRRVAFRRSPYSLSRPTDAESAKQSKFSRYVDLIRKSHLKKAEKRYWLAFAEQENKE